MEDYAVPQREVQVKARLLDGQELVGTMYTPLEGPDGEPGHLIDHLNEESEQFIALNDGTSTHLIQAHRLLTVQVAGDKVEERVEDEIEHAALARNLLIKVNLDGGVELIGNLTYLQPPDHARLLDYLNAANRFIPLVIHQRLTYVNREQIISVRALRGE